MCVPEQHEGLKKKLEEIETKVAELSAVWEALAESVLALAKSVEKHMSMPHLPSNHGQMH